MASHPRADTPGDSRPGRTVGPSPNAAPPASPAPAAAALSVTDAVRISDGAAPPNTSLASSPFHRDWAIGPAIGCPATGVPAAGVDHSRCGGIIPHSPVALQSSGG